MRNRIIKASISALIMFLGQAVMCAQGGTSGTWHGLLEVPGGSLTLVLHLSQEECVMDSPDQMVYGIPAEIKEISQVRVNIYVPSLDAGFEGNLTFGLLVGKFRQAGMEFPLTLKRGEPVRKRPQTPQPPFPYMTEECTFTNTNDGAVLSGTLTYPENHGKETPVVLFVSGSGLQDRNEEISAHKPFMVIADRLARNGIASLRYDDRSVGKSTGDASNATTETFKADAEAGLDFLKNLDRFGMVGIIGHSEGGTIAFLLAGEGKTDFIVSLAGAAVSGSEILLEQNELMLEKSGIPSETANAYRKALEKLYGNIQISAEELDGISYGLPEALRANLQSVREALSDNAWLRYFITLDPSEQIKNIKCPVMAVNGEKDVQVIAGTNMSAIGQFLPPSDKNMLKTYPGLNHMFQPCSTGMPDEYGRIESTVSEEVLNDIIGWIKSL